LNTPASTAQPAPGTSAACSTWTSRHPLLLFFALAYRWTWGLTGLAMLGSAAGIVREDAPLVALLANAVPFGPTLAALVVATSVEGRAGLQHLLGSLDPRRVSLGWYLLALCGPPLAILLGATLVYGAAPLLALATRWPLIFTRYLPYTLTVALLGTGLAEEVGWRGFAQPRLQQRHGPLVGSLVLGSAVGLWHLPNLLTQPGGIHGVALQIVYTTVVALCFTWAYNRNRGSALIVALLHAALNTSTRLLSALVPIGDLAQFLRASFWIAIVVSALAGALVVACTGGRLAAPTTNRTSTEC
jgi:uncharacterized protein